MARSPGAARLVPLVVAAAAAALLALSRDRELGPPLLPALLSLAGGLFVLHTLVALHQRQTTAFLAGLELAYATLLLLRSHASPLLGLEAQGFARLLTVLAPLALIPACLPGRGRPLGAGAVLRAAWIAGLPLLAALARRAFPAAVAAALELRLVTLPAWAALSGLSAVPQLAWPALAALLLLLAARRGRGLYELCLAAGLLPRYLLLAQASGGALRGLPARGALTAVLCLLALLYGLYRLFWQRAFLDELTGIGNRRSFEEALRALPRRYVLAMLDIDHFKAVNDTYGHAEGDHVLRWVAARIRAAFGASAFRYGGEEFAVLLPESGLEEARQRLERLRRELAEARFVLRGGRDRRAAGPGRRAARARRGAEGRERRSGGRDRRAGAERRVRGGARAKAGPGRLQVTVSAGLSEAAGGSDRPQEVLARADQALYRAKQAGRNRVVAATRGRPAARR